MNLWVRNQDKTIFQKVDNLLISDEDNAGGTFNIYTNLLPAQNILGRYKTKERALEVLDEIQDALLIAGSLLEETKALNIEIKSYFAANSKTGVAIYQMPEK